MFLWFYLIIKVKPLINALSFILDHAKTFKLFKSNSRLAQCGFFLEVLFETQTKTIFKNLHLVQTLADTNSV